MKSSGHLFSYAPSALVHKIYESMVISAGTLLQPDFSLDLSSGFQWFLLAGILVHALFQFPFSAPDLLRLLPRVKGRPRKVLG